MVDTLLRETNGENVLDFFYDASGTPVAFKYNDNVYYYITNLLGDVIRLVDSHGNTAACYEYDPYGNALDASGSHATINPLRYRGYYYDSETGLYYCQSRYYDPVVGRFINADEYASTGQGILGNNMFAYCGNNPVNNTDESGTRYVAVKDPGGGVPQKDTSDSQRDVTTEIAKPLNEAVDRARTLSLFSDFTNDIFGAVLIYPEFYRLVNHKAPWDIKRQDPWENTIGTEYPGYNVEVTFCGYTMIPEYLGNFTYGYLGHAYDIPYPILIAGSYYAADFPTSGADLQNEVNDWRYITMGYIYAEIKYLEGY